MVAMKAFVPPNVRGRASQENGVAMYIRTLEGTMLAREGDWIIKGVAGEFWPCKAHVFNATYEPVVDETANGGEKQ
jgi:hypothetical protein